jgi:hypothetical protein
LSNPKKADHGRVAIGSDVASSSSLVERAQVVGAAAPKTPEYTGNPTFKSVIDDFVTSGQNLDTAEKKVTQLESALTQARADRDQARFAAEDCHGAAVKQVERVSKNAADVASYGFVHLEIVKNGAVVPSGILAAFDLKKRVIDVHVKYPPGIRGRRVILEISTDPIGPSTYHRLDGDGVRRSLDGYAPGTYWIRAATSVAGGRSDWCGPVHVVVT